MTVFQNLAGWFEGITPAARIEIRQASRSVSAAVLEVHPVGTVSRPFSSPQAARASKPTRGTSADRHNNRWHALTLPKSRKSWIAQQIAPAQEGITAL